LSLLYNFFVSLSLKGAFVLSFFSPKIRLWLNGRKSWKLNLEAFVSRNSNSKIWFHCASLGEFEQGKPVMQALKEAYPQISIVVTFFSPSGYEARKNSELADYVGYLPADTEDNATDFIEILKPKLAVFVKSEIWPNFISAIKSKNVPSFLISARFYDGQSIFKRNRNFFRKQLKKFDFIFVQDKASQKQLKKFNIESVLTGDTRFDQVPQLLKSTYSNPIIEKFKGENALLVIGSCWNEDLEVLLHFINTSDNTQKIILAPHDVSSKMVSSIESKLNVPFIKYTDSDLKLNFLDKKVLILNTIGVLANSYKYANVAYVGGAFKQGLHNILEPAIFGIPVIFGPKTTGFLEANEMINAGGAFSVSNSEETTNILDLMFSDITTRKNAGNDNKNYMASKVGATEKIMNNARVILARRLEIAQSPIKS